MFTPSLRCECAQPASDRLMRKWCIELVQIAQTLQNEMSMTDNYSLLNKCCVTLLLAFKASQLCRLM